MALKKGEVYMCPDEDCGCEITVTRGAGGSKAGMDLLPRCCCGLQMDLRGG